MDKTTEWLSKLGEYRGVVMCGLPGSGKSYWAERIAREVGARVLSSDKFRERLFGSVRLDLAGDKVVGDLSKKAYEMMYDEVVELLQAGKKVVVDATNLKPGRKKYLDRIKRVTDKVVIVVVRASKQSMALRMKRVKGLANEKETFYEAWKRVDGYFEEHFARGNYRWPSERTEGVTVIEFNND